MSNIFCLTCCYDLIIELIRVESFFVDPTESNVKKKGGVSPLKRSENVKPVAPPCTSVQGDNRESRVNRERSRRCNSVFALSQGQKTHWAAFVGHCHFDKDDGKAADRVEKSEDLLVSDQVKQTDEDSVVFYGKVNASLP